MNMSTEVMDMPLVSIIMPVYNVELYIEKSLMSLSSQSYKNYELIIIDDGSTDKSIDVAVKTLKEMSVHYQIISKPNGGQGDARNCGAKYVRGQWMMFFDSDDVLQPDALECMIHCVKQNPNVNFVFSEYQYVKLGDEFCSSSGCCDFCFFDRETLQNEFLLRRKIVLVPGTLYNVEWYRKHRFSFESIPYSEDQLFMWNILMEVTTVGYVHKVLYNYLVRPGSIMTASKYNNVLLSYSSFEALHQKVIKSPNASGVMKSFFFSRWVIGILHSTAKLCSYIEYKTIEKCFSAKKHCVTLLKFPQLKVRILAICYLLSPKIFYYINRKVL